MQAEKIIAIKYVGKKQTLNLTVDNDSHLFYANGIATSNSHGCEYAMTSYWCAWTKIHFPLHFYAAWLHHAKDKLDPQIETKELIFDAQNFNIDIEPPSILKMKQYGGIVSIYDNKVYFGGGDIKGIGIKQIENIISNIHAIEQKLSKQIQNWSWFEFLIHYTTLTNKTVVNGLMLSGALDHMGISRNQMNFEYKKILQLSAAENKCLIDNCDKYSSLVDGLQYVLTHKTTKKRQPIVQSIIQELQNPPYSLVDTMKDICNYENQLLGVPITYSTTELLSTANADTTCKEFLDGKTGTMSIAIEIQEVRSFAIKNGNNKGKKMAVITGNDESGSLNCIVAFPEQYEAHKSKLYKDNIVVIFGEKNFRNNQFSFVIKEVEQL